MDRDYHRLKIKLSNQNCDLKQSNAKASNNNNKLILKFVDIDSKLERIERISQEREIYPIKNSVTKLRNQLFELCNLVVYKLEVNKFASHRASAKTPLNCTECA